MVDADLRVLDSLGAAAREGLTPLGSTLREHWGPDDPVGAIAAHERALSGESVVSEVEIEGHHLASRLEPLRDESGAIVGVAGIGLDVTEHRALQHTVEHAQRVETIGNLAGGIAHDFNNMLMAVTGNLDLALRRPDEPRYLENARAAAERSGDLVRQLLAYSRKQVLRPQVVAVNDVIERHVAILRPLLGEGVRVALDLHPDAGSVSVDVTQFEQVLLNLAVNARDATSGGGTVTFRTRRRGEWVEVAVTDTGTGIDPADLDRIFDPFFTTKDGGTGLGLSTAFGIVAQSGGRIDVESAPGDGSSFSVRLPAAA